MERGLQPVNNLRQHIRADYRPTAQYYEAVGRPMLRSKEHFAFDDLGISPDRAVAGLILRQAREGDLVLAVASRRFRAVFLDLSEANNCLHANPFAGDLMAGEVSELKVALYLLHGSLEDVAFEAAKRSALPAFPPGIGGLADPP